jgi:hypothetical protein
MPLSKSAHPRASGEPGLFSGSASRELVRKRPLNTKITKETKDRRAWRIAGLIASFVFFVLFVLNPTAGPENA